MGKIIAVGATLASAAAVSAGVHFGLEATRPTFEQLKANVDACATELTPRGPIPEVCPDIFNNVFELPSSELTREGEDTTITATKPKTINDHVFLTGAEYHAAVDWRVVRRKKSIDNGVIAGSLGAGFVVGSTVFLLLWPPRKEFRDIP